MLHNHSQRNTPNSLNHTVCNIQIQNHAKYGKKDVVLHTVRQVLDIETKFKHYKMENIEYKRIDAQKIIIQFGLNANNEQKLKQCLQSITNEVNRLLSRHITIKGRQYRASYLILQETIKHSQTMEPGQIFYTQHEQKYNNNNNNNNNNNINNNITSQYQYEYQYEPGATKQAQKYNPYDFVTYSDESDDNETPKKTKSPYDNITYSSTDDDETNKYQTTTTTTTNGKDILDEITSDIINKFIESPIDKEKYCLIKEYDENTNKIKILEFDDKEYWIKCDKNLKSTASGWSWNIHAKLSKLQLGFYIAFTHNCQH